MRNKDLEFLTSAEAASLGGVGILLGGVGGVLMLVAEVSGVPRTVGLAGLVLLLVGLSLAMVQSWRIARAGGVGFFRSFFRCIRRAFSFLFWMMP
jgi:membrane-bound ClpP family serine protease